MYCHEVFVAVFCVNHWAVEIQRRGLDLGKKCIDNGVDDITDADEHFDPEPNFKLCLLLCEA